VPDVLSIRKSAPDAAGTPALMPFAMNARGLAAMLSGSVRWVRTQDSAGKLPKPVRVSGRVLWLRDEIEAWLRAGAPDRAMWEALKASQSK
jgi:predicted DNA-binding transcriptional regulator AlpA